MIYVNDAEFVCEQCHGEVIEKAVVERLRDVANHYYEYSGSTLYWMIQLKDALAFPSVAHDDLQHILVSMEYDDHMDTSVPVEVFEDMHTLLTQIETCEAYEVDFASSFDEGEGVWCCRCGRELVAPRNELSE